MTRDTPGRDGAPSTTSATEVSPGRATSGWRASRVRASRFQFVLLLLVITFGVLAYLARSTPYWGFDLTVTRAIQSIDVYGFGTVLEAISWVGFPPQFAIVCGLLVVAVFVLGHRLETGALLLDSLGAGALWFASTRLIDRPRPSPELVRVASEVHGGSFPSGHVLTIVAIFGFVVFLAYARLQPSWQRTLILIAFGLPIAVVGVARIYAGHHWPSDVLGGYMLGGMWLAVVVHLYRRRLRAANVAVAPTNS